MTSIFFISHKFNDNFDAGETFSTLEDAQNFHIPSGERYTAEDMRIDEFDVNGNFIQSHKF